MTHPALVPALDLVTDVCEDRMSCREALAIIRAKGMTPDVEALADAVHYARQVKGLAEGDIDPLTLCDTGHWGGSIGGCRAYYEARATDALDEALERLSMRGAVAV